VHYSSDRSFSPRSSFLNKFRQLQKPFGSLLLATGLATIASAGFASATQVPTTTAPAVQNAPVLQAVASLPPLEDGTYLYGESSTPQQIGSAYMVFEVNDRQVVGAFYMPSSSFDCFHGDIQANQLALTVTSSEDQQSYSYSLAMQPSGTVATVGNVDVAPAEIDGYHRIATVSAMDHQILAVCKADANHSAS
jgi:hypothetical protein